VKTPCSSILIRQIKVLAIAGALCALGTGQQSLDLKSLIGKKAIAQRMPWYEPGTYKAIPNGYAGQEVTIIGFKPMAMPKIALNPELLARLSPQQRAAIQDSQNMLTLIVQFGDGTKADTGIIVGSLLANYLELVGPPVSMSTGESRRQN
jgi:hypothetical protein